MQSWSAPPPAAPNRGKWIALGLGAFTLAVITGVVIWLIVRPDSSTKSNPSSTTSSNSNSVAGPEQEFLDRLAGEGITWSQGKDAEVVEAAQAVCTDWNNGADLDKELASLTPVEPGWTDFQAGFFIGAATKAFCPQYAYKVKPH